MPTPDDIVLKQIPREQRVKFYVCVGVTVAMVVAGWALSMRDQISLVSWVAPTPILQDVKEGVAQITAEVKANTNEPAVELEAALGAILEPVVDGGAARRQQAIDTVGEIMAESLPEETAP
jgi:hypothetical protein